MKNTVLLVAVSSFATIPPLFGNEPASGTLIQLSGVGVYIVLYAGFKAF